MIKKVILSILFLVLCVCVHAQYKVEVSPHKSQKIDVRLSDDFNRGNYLMNLPLAFSISNKKVLIIMVGDDMPLYYDHSVWFFAKDIDLAELIKKNRNVSASKSFKKQNRVLNRISYHRKMTLYRAFEDGYEVVKKNAKPIFFEISNLAPNESISFSLQFYVAQPDTNFPYVLLAKCKPIDIELTIK